MKEDQLLTAQQAADYMGLSLAAFYAWRRRHQVASRIKGRSLRFYARDLVQGAPPTVDFAELGRQHAREAFKEARREATR